MTKADIPRLATITTARGMPHLLEGELSGPGSGPPVRHRTRLRPPTRRRRSSCLSALPRSPRYGSTVADLRGKAPGSIAVAHGAPPKTLTSNLGAIRHHHPAEGIRGFFRELRLLTHPGARSRSDRESPGVSKYEAS